MCRRAFAAVACVVLQTGAARSHQGHLHWWEVGTTWTWDPLVTVPTAVIGVLWAVGVTRLWRRVGPGRGVSPAGAACFLGGWWALIMALVSPLHWLGERLFAVHMIEHNVLMTVAAPLLVLGRPMGPMLWGLPVRWRIPMGSALRMASGSVGWRVITGPVVATAAHGAALWLWHVPALYEAALANPRVHWLQHLSFFLTALVFWWALLRRRDRGYGVAVLCLLITSIHAGMLGALLVGARDVLYPLQSATAADWGLAALEDQQLAGLIMWVPGGIVYGAAALALAGVWIARTIDPDGSSSPASGDQTLDPLRRGAHVGTAK